MKTLTLVGLVSLACVASGQYTAPPPNKDLGSFKITIPPEPIAPSGFDYGRMSEQGELNEYRIGKLEADVKEIRATTDFVKGAWWVIVGALGLLVILLGITHKFLGKYIGLALVEHYASQAKPLPRP